MDMIKHGEPLGYVPNHISYSMALSDHMWMEPNKSPLFKPNTSWSNPWGWAKSCWVRYWVLISISPCYTEIVSIWLDFPCYSEIVSIWLDFICIKKTDMLNQRIPSWHLTRVEALLYHALANRRESRGRIRRRSRTLIMYVLICIRSLDPCIIVCLG